MKKLMITGTAFLLLSAFARAQAPAGLDSVIVEKYYVSDANDTTVNSIGGMLPLHSVTYRVFVDLKPGYTFEAAYGKDSLPHGGSPSTGDHELRFETSTFFFNNEDRGNTNPNGSFTKTQALNNTVMLDSWFSTGAACTAQFGVLKSEDNGVANAVNADGVLQNADPYAGIPLTTQDGFLAASSTTVTLEPFSQIGISSNIPVFGDGTTNGPLFSTYNGSWFSNNSVGNGATGPTVYNRVLIGQFTTAGTFSFMLNLQLGTPTGGVEHWVANSPVGGEATHPTLTYSNTPPANLGIASNNSGSIAFSVYPNPATDAVTIDITNKAGKISENSYTVYGIDGKVVVSKKIGTVADRYIEKVDMSNVAPGLYFVELNQDGVRSTRKITKN